MEDIKDAQKVGQVSAPGVTPTDVLELQNKIKSLETELECSNKRATDAERRNDEMLLREKEIQQDISSLEDELVKKLEKKSKKCLEAQDKVTELETVTQEMYEELQKALGISSRLDMECQTLRLQLDLSKGNLLLLLIYFSHFN
jgi:chromosome segregation ATPase